MDISPILASLNPAQRAAVTAELRHALVIAGAGSGKTRVLVHRIAFLLATDKARPHNLLAVTFTNKAASEMRHRIQTLIKTKLDGLWSGTFHGLAHRLLRIHWEEAELPENFQIIDSDDQRRLIKQLIKDNHFDEKAWKPKEVQQFFNRFKDKGQRAESLDLSSQGKWFDELGSIYKIYEQQCHHLGLVDFSELLLKSYELFQKNSMILEKYQSRFQHIFVDEFQDINWLQYRWLKQLAGNKNQLFVVGDDDQSIYSWRGAMVENILNFQKDFSQPQTFRLEQNYRSSGTILTAANQLISNNSHRLGKNLWTDQGEGEPIYLFTGYREYEEAEFVVEKIKTLTAYARQEISILYRTSAQSRLFEEALLQNNIAYRIYGGVRFYERAEIKDSLAYLRLLVYRDDDSALERVINVPKRGIGHKTLDVIRATARQKGSSLWQAIQNLIETQQVSKRVAHLLVNFCQLIETLAVRTATWSLDKKVAYVNQHSGLIDYYQQNFAEESQKRLENLNELVNAAKQFRHSNKEKTEALVAFLSHAVLEAGEGESPISEDYVQLMTLHLAKGLEFKVVFLVGLEQGLFPHETAIQEGNLEEERRLCYVGMTRSKALLYLSYCETRQRMGKRLINRASQFIHELPITLIQEVRMRRLSSQINLLKNSFSQGERVRHEKFGKGQVLLVEGEGEFTRLQVHFDHEGVKWLMLAFTHLERC